MIYCITVNASVAAVNSNAEIPKTDRSSTASGAPADASEVTRLLAQLGINPWGFYSLDGYPAHRAEVVAGWRKENKERTNQPVFSAESLARLVPLLRQALSQGTEEPPAGPSQESAAP